MDTYQVRIDYLHFMGMIRKMFEQRKVWERVVVEPLQGNDNYQTQLKVELVWGENAPFIDIFQSKEKSWLEDYHVGIENVSAKKDRYVLRLVIH